MMSNFWCLGGAVRAMLFWLRGGSSPRPSKMLEDFTMLPIFRETNTFWMVLKEKDEVQLRYLISAMIASRKSVKLTCYRGPFLQ